MDTKITYCLATTKHGKPCRAAATSNGYCFFHGNPEKAAELGRRGGRNNRHVIDSDPTPFPALTNIGAVKQAVAITIEDVRSRRLDPRTATALPALFNTLIRTFHSQDLEDQICDLQKQLLELVVKTEKYVRGVNAESHSATTASGSLTT